MTPTAQAVLLYLAATTLLGALLARRTRSANDWAVAGGGMGFLGLTAGLAGTRIGGAGIYGVAGDVIGGGVWNLWWYGISTFLALAFMGLLFSVPYRRLGLQTVGELFTLRYGSRRGQALCSLCVQTEYLVVNVIEAYVTASLLRSLIGMPYDAALAAAAAILAIYTALGGLWGAAYTNLVHCGVIVAGLATVGYAGIERLGGPAAVQAAVAERLAAAGRDEAAFWAFTGPGFGPVLAMVFSAAIHTPAASIYANFSTAARDERLLRPAFLAAATLAGAMPLLAGSIGILTLARFGPAGGLSGYASITALATELSPVVGGLAVAAILAAVVSTGGPILLSSATLFVRDWIPASAAWSPERRLRGYRLATLGYAVVAAVLARFVAQSGVSLLGLLLLGYAAVVPPAVAAFFVLYWRRTSEAGALWGMGLGLFAGAAGFAWIQLAGAGPDPSYATTLVPLLVVPLLSLWRPEPKPGHAFYETLGRPRERGPA